MTARRRDWILATLAGLSVAVVLGVVLTRGAAAAPVAGIGSVEVTVAASDTASAAASDAASAAPSDIASPPAEALQGPQPLPPVHVVTATSLQIPAIGVSTALEKLSLGAGGVLNPPADFRKAGWFAAGVVPGDPGPAVIAGHIDSYSGPAVFLHLAELKAGAVVSVQRSDGRTVRFRVTSTLRFSKDAFPTALVYGPTPTAELRLITCGGVFDHAAQRYPDDVVVFAEMV